jgi:hypothetical protein
VRNNLKAHPNRLFAIGIVLIITGGVVHGSWVIWTETRNLSPIDMPISVTPGHIQTPEFKINMDAVYMIEISADKDKFPSNSLHCLLGYKFLDSDCADTPSVIKAKWKVLSQGNFVAEGSSDDPHGGAFMDRTIARSIGSFDGQDGSTYKVDVDILADGSKLSGGNPHLRIDAFPYPTGIAALGPFTFTAMVVFEVGGIIMFVVFATQRLRQTRAISTV